MKVVRPKATIWQAGESTVRLYIPPGHILDYSGMGWHMEFERRGNRIYQVNQRDGKETLVCKSLDSKGLVLELDKDEFTIDVIREEYRRWYHHELRKKER